MDIYEYNIIAIEMSLKNILDDPELKNIITNIIEDKNLINYAWIPQIKSSCKSILMNPGYDHYDFLIRKYNTKLLPLAGNSN
jgi:hypothetical protein